MIISETISHDTRIDIQDEVTNTKCDVAIQVDIIDTRNSASLYQTKEINRLRSKILRLQKKIVELESDVQNEKKKKNSQIVTLKLIRSWL